MMLSPLHFEFWKKYAFLFLLAFLFLSLPACSSTHHKKDSTPTVAATGKQVVSTDDDLDEYDAATRIADPIEPVNRAIFTFNHYLYKGVIRPVSKTYEFLVPSLVRKGINNAYENVRFPVRFVNHSLQGKFDRAGREFEKFFVNSTLGVGGIMRPSDKFPALAEVPDSDTGQTFAKWGIHHGYYLVLPLLGPSSVRDGVGRIGDAGLNPVTWVAFIFGGATWTLAVSAPDSARSWPEMMDGYNTITKEAVDPYLATRTSFVQYRNNIKNR